MDSNIIIVGDINIYISVMGRIFIQKTNKKTENLNNTSDQMGVIDLHKISHQTATEYTILLKCLQDILHNKSHFRSQNKS
jgi:hypothetical protein